MLNNIAGTTIKISSDRRRNLLMLSVPDKPPDKPLLPYIELRTGYYLQKGRPHIRKQMGFAHKEISLKEALKRISNHLANHNNH